MENFAATLKYYVQERKINVNNLAQICELERSTVYKFLNGKRTPSTRATVHRLAQGMQLSPMECLFR